MGRITVFSTAACPHCKRAKGLLASKGWDYVEVSLSDYPEKRTAMLQLADKLSVPQIFFNESHLGGASELAALDEQGQLNALYESMTTAPDPTDERLAKPDYAPPPPPEPPSREPEPQIALGDADGTSATYPEIAAQLASELAIERRTFCASVYNNCFVGAEAVDVLMQLYALPTREEAVALGVRLQQAGMFDHVVEGSGHTFKDEFLFYRLQAHASPKTLNSCRCVQNFAVQRCLSQALPSLTWPAKFLTTYFALVLACVHVSFTIPGCGRASPRVRWHVLCG
jgi:glutaredoxin 3